MEEEKESEIRPADPQLQKIRHAAGNLYDLQKLRIQSGNRAGSLTAELDERDKEFMAAMSSGLDNVEQIAEKHLKRHLKGYPIYEKWLKKQSGCGVKMSGVIISSINIHKADTVSKVWAYCGLSVVDGHAQRRVKGQTAKYNPWLKAKVVKVLGDNLIRYSKLDDAGNYVRSTTGKPIDEDIAWRRFYDNYKHRQQNKRVPVCMACEGTGKTRFKPKNNDDDEVFSDLEEDAPKRKTKPGVCANCEGTGGPAPWGKSDGHRHNAARRYMVKMFLLEMWKKWRELEGLPAVPPYAEVYLGLEHGGHGVPQEPA